MPSVRAEIAVEPAGAGAVARAGAGTLRIRYELVNDGAAGPIYVFDRLLDWDSKQVRPDWAYVAFEGDAATVSRQVWPVHESLSIDPEVPCARTVAPGERVRDELRVALPLAETDPYYEIRNRLGRRGPVPVRTVSFAVGWCPVEGLDHPGHHKLVFEDGELAPLDYSDVIGRQEVARSAAQPVEVEGVALR